MMVAAFLVLLGFQLAGEWLQRAFALPVPGPVLGMALLLVALFAVPRLHGKVQGLAHGLLRGLSLLFVPAGVGVMTMLGDVRRHAAVLLLVIFIGTWITALATAWVFEKTGGGA